MQHKWYDTAIKISQTIGCEVIPVLQNKLPKSKLDASKWPNEPLDNLPSSDPAIIELWASQFAAYGVVAGSHCLIVDVDCKDGQFGHESLAFLKSNGLNTNTFTVQSPSGGLHLYYKVPKHYKPKQDSNIRVLFTSLETQKDWDALQVNHKSTGIDTRFGNGYVVGPGSVVSGGEYKLLADLPLAEIPTSMRIGTPTVSTYNYRATVGSVSADRNNDMLGYTNGLVQKRLSDEQVAVLIKERLKVYVGDNPPTFDESWSMYERGSAKFKPENIVDHLLDTHILLTDKKRVFNILNGRTNPFEDLVYSHANKMISMDTDGKTKRINPMTIWHGHADRKSASTLIFDPTRNNGLIVIDDVTYYNVFEKPFWPQAPYNEEGQQMVDALERLFETVLSNEYDRVWFMKWFGSLIMDPSYRPAWHWHIFSSNRGIGKDTLARVVCKMYGKQYTLTTGDNLFISNFNKTFFDNGLIILSDFKKVVASKFGDVNAAFKQITGTGEFSREEKFQESSKGNVHCRFILLSNHGDDFPVDVGDRRLYKCQSIGVKLPVSDYRIINKFLDGENSDAIDYAAYILYSKLKESGWEVMYDTSDCPYNETKSDYETDYDPEWYSELKSMVEHASFVFESDLVTIENVHAFRARYPKTNATSENILKLAVQNGLFVKIKYRENDPNHPTLPRQIASRRMEYDRESDMIRLVGEAKMKICYSIRNHSDWTEGNRSTASKGPGTLKYEYDQGYASVLIKDGSTTEDVI